MLHHVTMAGKTKRFRSTKEAVDAARVLSRDNPTEIVKVWRGENLLAQFYGGVGTTTLDCAHLLETPRPAQMALSL